MITKSRFRSNFSANSRKARSPASRKDDSAAAAMLQLDQYQLQLSTSSSSEGLCVSDTAGLTPSPLLARGLPAATNTRQFKVKMFRLLQ